MFFMIFQIFPGCKSSVALVAFEGFFTSVGSFMYFLAVFVHVAFRFLSLSAGFAQIWPSPSVSFFVPIPKSLLATFTGELLLSSMGSLMLPFARFFFTMGHIFDLFVNMIHSIHWPLLEDTLDARRYSSMSRMRFILRWSKKDCSSFSWLLLLSCAGRGRTFAQGETVFVGKFLFTC